MVFENTSHAFSVVLFGPPARWEQEMIRISTSDMQGLQVGGARLPFLVFVLKEATQRAQGGVWFLDVRRVVLDSSLKPFLKQKTWFIEVNEEPDGSSFTIPVFSRSMGLGSAGPQKTKTSATPSLLGLDPSGGLS